MLRNTSADTMAARTTCFTIVPSAYLLQPWNFVEANFKPSQHPQRRVETMRCTDSAPEVYRIIVEPYNSIAAIQQSLRQQRDHIDEMLAVFQQRSSWAWRSSVVDKYTQLANS